MPERRKISFLRCGNWFCAGRKNRDYTDAYNVNIADTTEVPLAATSSDATTSSSSHVNIPQASTTTAPSNIKDQQPTSSTSTTTTATTMLAKSNAVSTAAQPAHNIVTVLDDVPSGSNGVVNTSNRLVTEAELYAARMSGEELVNIEEFTNAGQILLLNESQPLCRNCFRMVMLG